MADWVYRQAVTSAGSGSSAALDAERWLSENQLATGGDDEAAEECMPEDYESWTMKQIRKELKERGVDVGAECRGCSEKREFIEVLAATCDPSQDRATVRVSGAALPPYEIVKVSEVGWGGRAGGEGVV